MCGKKNKILLWLAVGYIAGNVVSSMYSKKGGRAVRNELADAESKGEGKFKVLLDEFVATHSNMFNDVKDEVMTEENIAKFNEYKDEAMKLVDSYKKKAMVQVRELKRKGEGYLAEAQDKLQEGYDEALAEINRIKDLAPKKAQELKRKLKITFDEIKEEMEELVK